MSSSSTDSSMSPQFWSTEREARVKFIDYGPIRVHLTGKAAPTLATGRRSKHIILSGDAAIKRENRREKNRAAARRLKAKRASIEEELLQKIRILEDEHIDLQTYLGQLRSLKQRLEIEVNNNLFFDSITELLITNEGQYPFTFDEYIETRHPPRTSSFSSMLDFDAISNDPSEYH